jgi:hypothetical protein
MDRGTALQDGFAGADDGHLHVVSACMLAGGWDDFVFWGPRPVSAAKIVGGNPLTKGGKSYDQTEAFEGRGRLVLDRRFAIPGCSVLKTWMGTAGFQHPY